MALLRCTLWPLIASILLVAGGVRAQLPDAAEADDEDAQLGPTVGPRASKWGCPQSSAGGRFQRCFESFSLLIDQDLFLDAYPGSGNQDRNYTMGVGIQVQGAVAKYAPTHWPLFGLDLLFGIEAAFFLPERLHPDAIVGLERSRTKLGFTFGDSAFTPDELGETRAIPGDRPYASLLYFTSSRSTVRGDNLAIRTEFTFGLLGLDLSRKVQTALHRAVRGPDETEPKDPRGWSHQVSHGGEPTFRYGVAAKWLLVDQGWMDLSALGELNVGTYTNVAGGLSLRVGVITTPFWGFTSNPLGIVNQVAEKKRGDFDLYTFATVRERAVAYNAMLQGQFRHSDVRVAAQDVERLITEYEVGIVGGMPRWFTLTIAAIAGRTPEYEGALARAHRWASVYLTIGSGGEP